MTAVHMLGIAGIVLYPPSWSLIALCIGSYYIRMFGITAGYHRYFAHRTFRTSRWFQFVLAFLGSTATQRGALWWAAHHRDHHRHSDTEIDLHSPIQRGFWWSHIGWIVHSSSTATRWNNIKDFTKYPELVVLDNWRLVAPIVYATTLYWLGGGPALFWGYFLSTAILWHGTFVINSLCHVWGSRRFETSDTSRNNLWLALLTLGEGWHNNHHHYHSSARQGWLWWEVDGTYYALKLLEKLRIVEKLKGVPERVWSRSGSNAISNTPSTAAELRTAINLIDATESAT
ncbi:MAG: acyl-CoA desaturase [Myxococcales bacterium]|nr:acyl-CoA desaturase [Myxococcales bacterium]